MNVYNLIKSAQSLKVVLSGAKNTNDCDVTVGYVEGRGGPRNQPQMVHSHTNGVTAVTLLTGMSVGRSITGISFYNNDLAAVTLTFEIVDASTGTTTVIKSVTLQTLESLDFSEARGWYSTDANGNTKTNQPASSGAASTADSKAVLASSQASSILANVATPGSSQASSIAALTPASVSSQASSVATLQATHSSTISSMVALVPASVSSQASSMAAIEATISSIASRVKSSFSW